MPNEKKPKTKYVEYLRHAEYYDMQSTFDGKRQILMRLDTKLPQPFASWSNSL